MKKLISLIVTAALAVTSVFALAGCNEVEQSTLTAPQNVVLSDTGLLTWDAVENAQSYTVTINGKTYTTATNSYQVESLDVDFTYSVVAEAEFLSTVKPAGMFSSWTVMVLPLGRSLKERNSPFLRVKRI